MRNRGRANEAIRKAMPEFSPSKIAAGAYHLLDKDYVTVGMYNFGVGRADLPDVFWLSRVAG
jgi:TRAP-type uncharacterized transport system substrate-binding protein